MYKEDTIAAVATPTGEGGVAIVRVSGPDSERIAAEIFTRRAGKNGRLRSHTLHHGVIRSPDECAAIVDEVLLVVMRKPSSYTGEDVVEVHCHGGMYVVQRILEIILSRGARHAEPGEFTKRAFLNGRMDLTQAEAVLDVIRARTEMGARLALGQMSGELSKWVNNLREELIAILVQVEAAIDFPEEEIELLKNSQLIENIDVLRKKIANLISTYEWGRLFREGAKVCILGRPNVGKSSLFNALLGSERVLVASVPGTTRDVIEESLNLKGLPIVLWDTAGIRDSEDEVEKMGVGLSLKQLEEANAVLVVLDGSQPIVDEDKSIFDAAQRKKGLVVINKADLPLKIDIKALSPFVGDKEISQVSAKELIGLTALKNKIRVLLLGSQIEPSVVINNVRHRAALERAEQGLKRASYTLDSGLPPEMLAVDMQGVRDALEEITGVVDNDTILEQVFTNFCIGK